MVDRGGFGGRERGQGMVFSDLDGGKAKRCEQEMEENGNKTKQREEIRQNKEETQQNEEETQQSKA